MPLARALVAGAVVTVFLAPATAGYAQESSTTTTHHVDDDHDHHHHSGHHGAAADERATDHAEARPRCVRGVGQPGEPEPGDVGRADRAGRRRPTQRLAELATEIAATQAKLDATRAETDRAQEDRACARRVHLPPRGRAADRGGRHRARAGHQRGEEVRGVRDAHRRHEDLGRSRSSRLSSTRTREQLEADRTEQQQQKDRLDNARTALEALTARQKKLLDQAGAIPVMGAAELTAAEITAWFEARNVKYRFAGGLPIADLVQLYMEEGKAENVRPELAFAQSIIETGSFGNALDNNYAGIGACDSCEGQPAFPTPRDGVRGQIQLLRNYADPTSRAANLANPRRPRSTATTRCGPGSSTTRSSPRVARRRGT